MKLQRAVLALAFGAWMLTPACKGKDETTAPIDLLECPADPKPVGGLGGRGSILLPNAFSPNGDGRNDMFRAVSTDTGATRNYNVRIVRSDGVIVKTLTRLSDSWDGYDASAGKPHAPGRYRVDYGILLHGGTGTDVTLNGHFCLKLYGTDSSGCLIRQGDPSGDVFEDMIDPAKAEVKYTTADRFCP